MTWLKRKIFNQTCISKRLASVIFLLFHLVIYKWSQQHHSSSINTHADTLRSVGWCEWQTERCHRNWQWIKILISKLSSIRMLSVHRQKLHCVLRVHDTVINSSLAGAEGYMMNAAERKRGWHRPGLWSRRWFPTSCRQSVQPLGRTPLPYWETNSSLNFFADKIKMCGLKAWQKLHIQTSHEGMRILFNSWSLALAHWYLQIHLNYVI